jgi:hypothetical protein
MTKPGWILAGLAAAAGGFWYANGCKGFLSNVVQLPPPPGCAPAGGTPSGGTSAALLALESGGTPTAGSQSSLGSNPSNPPACAPGYVPQYIQGYGWTCLYIGYGGQSVVTQAGPAGTGTTTSTTSTPSTSGGTGGGSGGGSPPPPPPPASSPTYTFSQGGLTVSGPTYQGPPGSQPLFAAAPGTTPIATAPSYFIYRNAQGHLVSSLVPPPAGTPAALVQRPSVGGVGGARPVVVRFVPRPTTGAAAYAQEQAALQARRQAAAARARAAAILRPRARAPRLV